MLILKTIRFKNFRSYGNQFTEIHLNKRKATVITAPNGSGKSTILMAIEYALFGRVSGGINKNDLVNLINKKDCIVELECEAKGREIFIRRGIRPNVFEIQVNGELVNQDSAIRDYQLYLEEEILGFNIGSFHQVVSVSGSSYTPFLLLSAGQRRRKVEDFLALTVFTKMNQLHLANIANNREELQKTETEIAKRQASIDSLKKGLSNLQSQKEEYTKGIQENIDKANEKIVGINSQIKDYNESIEEFQKLTVDLSKKTSKKTKLLEFSKEMKSKIQKIINFQNFLDTKDKCPTCSQPLDDDFKVEMKEESEAKKQELEKSLAQLYGVLDNTEEQLQAMQNVLQQIREHENAILVATNTITTLQSYITEQQKMLLRTDKGSDGELKNEIIKIYDEVAILKQQRLDILEERQYNEIISAIIKDTGIKSKIISQYIPKMNQEINHYLEILDLGISFEMNENFEERILSRFKDESSYSSFSAGERARIDIAILFTWRELAKLKNSLSCNLLFLDEIFDAVLDDSGLDAFINLLAYHLKDTNVFLISHRPEVVDKFETNLRITKVSNFSKIE